MHAETGRSGAFCRHLSLPFLWPKPPDARACRRPRAELYALESAAGPRAVKGLPGCGRWLTGITRTERRRTDMRQHGKPLCRRSLGAGTERRDRPFVSPFGT
jgi:hypothetical protein